jgi:hypothetical protein
MRQKSTLSVKNATNQPSVRSPTHSHRPALKKHANWGAGLQCPAVSGATGIRIPNLDGKPGARSNIDRILEFQAHNAKHN